MSVADTIEGKLRDAFQPRRLNIVDESHRHAGHAGARPEGETHFRLEIVTDAFDGKSRVERQRMVYDVLAEEIRNHVHALSLKTLTAAEDTTE